jgi:hypothetical protein
MIVISMGPKQRENSPLEKYMPEKELREADFEQEDARADTGNQPHGIEVRAVVPSGAKRFYGQQPHRRSSLIASGPTASAKPTL